VTFHPGCVLDAGLRETSTWALSPELTVAQASTSRGRRGPRSSQAWGTWEEKKLRSSDAVSPAVSLPARAMGSHGGLLSGGVCHDSR
jgi:hypothetical protein